MPPMSLPPKIKDVIDRLEVDDQVAIRTYIAQLRNGIVKYKDIAEGGDGHHHEPMEVEKPKPKKKLDLSKYACGAPTQMQFAANGDISFRGDLE
ncbi:hypothetical protein THAOC_33765 [Thalassiosira oceanica]|uniref:Uncharacterized protein n=2 Tax=Thalassiosira oceanica TaxID=159749 RepID=K0R6D6_THAOC|nr:hypothetical protein THAOC_33765 [Thalassiosira oceanica]|eukprot:EJK47509.1 hypothetical protein THAOC_33765 [Thalassiosira oceanica]